MVSLARIVASTVVLLGPIACLKPNPLVKELGEEAYGDESDSADDDETDEAPADLLELVCESPPEFEPECGACLVEGCCTSLAPCRGDPICVCMADCLFGGQAENECRQECEAMGSDIEPLAPLLSCAMDDCPDCFVVAP